MTNSIRLIDEKPLPNNFGDRRGKFRISKEVINSVGRDLMSFMSNFFIVRAEFLIDIDCMEYYALSELFDVVDEGHDTPEYEFIITKMSNGTLDIQAKRVNPEKGFKLLRKLRKLDV